VYQEELIVHDVELIDAFDNSETATFNLPDVSKLQYWYRHITSGSEAHKMHMQTASLHHEHSVEGHVVRFDPLRARFPYAHELLPDHTNFTACTLPVIVFSDWSMNFLEFLKNVVVNFETMLSSGETDTAISVYLATPHKLPIDEFNRNLMKPYAREVGAFAQLSGCFERVIIMKTDAGGYGGLPAVGARLLQAYDVPEPPPVSGKKVVVFETRPNLSMRQFHNMTLTMEACQGAGYECVAHTFGESFQRDMEVMRRVDALVTYHGAGEANLIFSKEGTALVEVHGARFGTDFLWWSGFWWPMISMQTHSFVHYWGLNVEHESRNVNSLLETEGLQTDQAMNARDRNVVLSWSMIGGMLQKAFAVHRDRAAYEAITGEDHMKNVLFTWNESTGSLIPEPPIFCSGECNHQPASPGCRPCEA
jgi:hypothetical protein